MFVLLSHVAAAVRHRCQQIRDARDDGYSAEAVVVIGLLVVLAIAVIAIISAKVTAKANSIDLG